MNDRDMDTLARLIKDAHRRHHNCVICGNVTPGFGLFSDPAWNEALGAPAGKTRFVIYGLCEPHSTLPYDIIAAAVAKALAKENAN